MAEGLIFHDEEQTLLQDPAFRDLADYFGIKKDSWNAYKDTLKYLLEWGKADPTVKDNLDLLWKVRTAEKQFQTESYKENRAATLKKFLFLNEQKDKITKEEEIIRSQNGDSSTVSGS